MNVEAGPIPEIEDAQLRMFAERLRTSPQARTRPDFTADVMAAIRAERAKRKIWMHSLSVWARAACLALLFAAGGVWLSRRDKAEGWSAEMLASCQRADGTFTESSAAPYVQAFAVTALARNPACRAETLDSAVGAIVRDQCAAGGWANATLSARNVAALQCAAAAGAAGAAQAYRRGRRYLQTHGIMELSSSDFMRIAKDAFAKIDASADRGILCSVALCAN